MCREMCSVTIRAETAARRRNGDEKRREYALLRVPPCVLGARRFRKEETRRRGDGGGGGTEKHAGVIRADGFVEHAEGERTDEENEIGGAFRQS